MTISPRQLTDTSPGIFSQTFDTYKLLLSVRDVLNTLQLDAEGAVMDPVTIQEDSVEDEVHLE